MRIGLMSSGWKPDILPLYEFCVAGDEGLEPSITGLEPVVFPITPITIHHTLNHLHCTLFYHSICLEIAGVIPPNSLNRLLNILE